MNFLYNFMNLVDVPEQIIAISAPASPNDHQMAMF